MKAVFIVAAAVTALMVAPPWLVGALDSQTASACATYSFCSAAVVMMFSPQLARFIGEKS